jgi:acyl-CoA thioesterase FadM
MDEVLGHLNMLSGQMAVTATITIEYVRPVPIGRPLELRAWCETIEDGRRHNRGELTLAATGAVLARGHGVWVERDESHFERYRQWIAAQDAKAPGKQGDS